MAIFGYVRKELLEQVKAQRKLEVEFLTKQWHQLLNESEVARRELEGLLTTQSICIDKLTRERDFYASKYKAMTAGLAQNRKREPKPKIGVWIAHNGGPNPVPGRKVVVRLLSDRRGNNHTVLTSECLASSNPESCSWQSREKWGICAYKVVE